MSSIFTDNALLLLIELSFFAIFVSAGSIYLLLSEPANSLAKPRTDIAYPRSGLIAISKITSETSNRAKASEPILPSGKTIIPAWSSLIPSSFAEQIMPSLTLP